MGGNVTPRLLLVTAVAVVGIAGGLVLGGCGDSGTASATKTTVSVATTIAAAPTTIAAPSTTTVSVPAGWKTFEDDAVSLALPDTFSGGVPTEEDVAALIDASVEGDPNEDETREAMEAADILLVMYGPVDTPGGQPMVVVTCESLLSVQSLKDYMILSDDTAVWEFKEESDERAYAVSVADDILEHGVAIRSGSSVYGVVYLAATDASAEMDAVFAASAATFSLKAK
jgi:hypothetical protein